MLMRIVYDRQLQGIEPLYWCVGQEWNLMQEQECRCKARQPPPCPCCRPLTAVSFSSIFPYMLPCARRACAPLPPLSAGDILRACAPASILQRVHHSVVTGIGRKLESMHKFTDRAHPQHNYALARAQRPAKMRPRAARPRAPQALAFSFFFSKIDKSSEEGWEDKKTASVLRSAACTADRRFNDRLPRLFSYCLPP